MTTSAIGLLPRLSRLQGLFKDEPEESQRLRTLSLLTMLWVAASLIWVSGQPVVPLGASAVAALGHAVSWYLRRFPLGWRSPLIVAGIVALSFAMRSDLLSGITGDRLIVASYLLMVQALSSFGLRTRGGLYAHLSMSGLVLFFVSERAFDPAFVAFLIVFSALFLTFTAMAFLEDQIAAAMVHWPDGQLRRVWFWLGIVGGGLLFCSALAFALLPPDYRGRAGAQRTGVVPFLGESTYEQQFGVAGLDPQGQGFQGQRDGDGAIEGVGGPFEEGSSLASLPAAEDFGGPQVPPDPRQVVMHVRSPITSYWRGRIFSDFDGETWRLSSDPLLEPALRDEGNFYWQAYFVQQDQPGYVFMGYKPIRLDLSDEDRERGGLARGSIYSVLSQRPDLRPDLVRRDETSFAGRVYRSLPPSDSGIRELSRTITEGATGPFDRMWNISGFLRSNYQFDPGAPSQLALTGSVQSFLANERPGSSLDFATATILLARAAGLPARLAVGYLPGRYDPFSGTHKVRRKDLHAWTEVRFDRYGWVAFDSTPRPELNVFTSGNFRAFSGGAYIFQTRVGGGLFSVIQGGVSETARDVGDALTGNTRLLVPAGIAVGAIVLAVTIYRWWLARVRRKGGDWSYTRLTGDTRTRILRTYVRLEALLRRNGLEPRERSQTLTGYLGTAAARFASISGELKWFENAALSAAYDPVEPADEVAREAARRLSRLKATRLGMSSA